MEPFFLGMPPTVVWDDLSERVRILQDYEAATFSNDQSILEFFDQLARALHRSEPRHVILLRESGVGEIATLAEFVRRGNRGVPPFLRETRFARVDCPTIPIELVREGLESRLNPGLRPENCVLCMDNFVRTSRAVGLTDGRGAAVSLLYRAHSRLIAIVNPREYEELAAEDGGVNELCSVVKLREPSPQVAEAMVRHMATGLEKQWSVKIDDEAVREVIVLSGNYILNQRLPAKAVRILKSICEDVEYERTQLF